MTAEFIIRSARVELAMRYAARGKLRLSLPQLFAILASRCGDVE